MTRSATSTAVRRGKPPCKVQQGFIEPESEGDSKAWWDSNVAPEWRRTRRDGGAITDNGLSWSGFNPSEGKSQSSKQTVGGAVSC